MNTNAVIRESQFRAWLMAQYENDGEPITDEQATAEIERLKATAPEGVTWVTDEHLFHVKGYNKFGNVVFEHDGAAIDTRDTLERLQDVCDEAQSCGTVVRIVVDWALPS